MHGARTRGQAAAIAAVDAMLVGGVPHAILLAGPSGSGKATLGLDLAAALLCGAPDPAARPCRACRTCRMVDAGNHPDLHRLAPGGAGQQIGIGGTDRARGVRDLLGELVLLPVEGGARVAIIEDAHRLNDEAQSALLKTLEEPPAGVVLLLCAEEEERLLPTVRSRCARVRLGPVGIRDIEGLLEEQGLADAPRAARLARIAAGRPGVAVSYARSADAETIRSEIARRLLDLRAGGVAPALVAVRELQARAVELARALESAAAPSGGAGSAASGGRGGKGRAARAGARAGARGAGTVANAEAVTADTGAAGAAGGGGPDGAGGEGAGPEVEAGTGARLAAPERRRGALLLVRTWADVTRDLALLALGERRRVREIALLDDLDASLATHPASGGAARGPAAPAPFLARLARAAELLEGNASPELVLDTLAAAWGARR